MPNESPTTDGLIRTTETKYGRQRSADSRHKPTSHGLDMDLLLFGDWVDEQAKVPRPDILTCAYVLQPLADLVPNLMHPTQAKTIRSSTTLAVLTTPCDLPSITSDRLDLGL